MKYHASPLIALALAAIASPASANSAPPQVVAVYSSPTASVAPEPHSAPAVPVPAVVSGSMLFDPLAVQSRHLMHDTRQMRRHLRSLRRDT